MSTKCKVAIVNMEWNKLVPSLSKLLLFWFVMYVSATIFAGLLLTPFQLYEKWIEHSLFLAQLFIGIGLFYFAAYEFGVFPQTLVRMIFWEPQQNCLVLACKYFLRYIGLFILLLGGIVGILTISDLFSGIPGGFSQTMDWSGSKNFIRYSELSSSGPGGLILFVLGVCILSPVIEELFYRRMLFVELRKHFGFWVSALFSSFIFAIFHWNIVIIVCMIGIYLAYVYEKEKNLSVNIILHAMINLFSIVLMALINSFPLK